MIPDVRTDKDTLLQTFVSLKDWNWMLLVTETMHLGRCPLQIF